MIRLSQIERAFKQTEAIATPHREPDFKILRQITGEDDPYVVMSLVFLEEYNTGYPGVLERYICHAGKNKVGFQIDLLPGYVVIDDSPVVQPDS